MSTLLTQGHWILQIVVHVYLEPIQVVWVSSWCTREMQKFCIKHAVWLTSTLICKPGSSLRGCFVGTPLKKNHVVEISKSAVVKLWYNVAYASFPDRACEVMMLVQEPSDSLLAGFGSCKYCDKGKFATGSASQSCQNCGDGKYQTASGMSSCLNHNFVNVCLHRGPGCFYYADKKSGISSGTICCHTTSTQ